MPKKENFNSLFMRRIIIGKRKEGMGGGSDGKESKQTTFSSQVSFTHNMTNEQLISIQRAYKMENLFHISKAILTFYTDSTFRIGIWIVSKEKKKFLGKLFGTRYRK